MRRACGLLALFLLVPPATACTLTGTPPPPPGLLTAWEPGNGVVFSHEIYDRGLGADCGLGNLGLLTHDPVVWTEGGGFHFVNLTTGARTLFPWSAGFEAVGLSQTHFWIAESFWSLNITILAFATNTTSRMDLSSPEFARGIWRVRHIEAGFALLVRTAGENIAVYDLGTKAWTMPNTTVASLGSGQSLPPTAINGEYLLFHHGVYDLKAAVFRPVPTTWNRLPQVLDGPWTYTHDYQHDNTTSNRWNPRTGVLDRVDYGGLLGLKDVEGGRLLFGVYSKPGAWPTTSPASSGETVGPSSTTGPATPGPALLWTLLALSVVLVRLPRRHA